MSRTVASAMATALASEHGELLHLFEFAFQTTTARFTTAAHDVRWAGATFVAVGGALRFEVVTESGDLSAATVQIRLSAVDRAAVAPVLAERYAGRVIRVWLGAVDATKKTIITTPLLLFNGYMNGAVDVEERTGGSEEGRSGGTVDLRVTVMDRLGALEQRRGLRTNRESHQQMFAGDEFFSSIGAMVNLQLPWGRTAG